MSLSIQVIQFLFTSYFALFPSFIQIWVRVEHFRAFWDYIRCKKRNKRYIHVRRLWLIADYCFSSCLIWCCWWCDLQRHICSECAHIWLEIRVLAHANEKKNHSTSLLGIACKTTILFCKSTFESAIWLWQWIWLVHANVNGITCSIDEQQQQNLPHFYISFNLFIYPQIMRFNYTFHLHKIEWVN